MSEYQRLNSQIENLIKLIRFLTPNSTPKDIAYIEANINEGLVLYKEAKQINIFKSLESILFEKGELLTKGIIERILNNFIIDVQLWKINYNKNTYRKSKHSVFLFESDDLQNLVIRFNGLIENTISEILNFVNTYRFDIGENKLTQLLEIPILKYEVWSEEDDDDDFESNEPEDIEKFQIKAEPIKIPNQDLEKVKSPTFKADDIPEILNILGSWFIDEQQIQLKELLTKTSMIPTSKLLFRGSGKTLLDFFKQLMKGQFLTIGVQKDLEEWISNRFEFMDGGESRKLSTKYASKIISGNERAALGNQLINVQNINGKFQIFQLPIKNREQN